MCSFCNNFVSNLLYTRSTLRKGSNNCGNFHNGRMLDTFTFDVCNPARVTPNALEFSCEVFLRKMNFLSGFHQERETTRCAIDLHVVVVSFESVCTTPGTNVSGSQRIVLLLGDHNRYLPIRLVLANEWSIS